MNISLTNIVSKSPAITATIIGIGTLLFATPARAEEPLKNGDFENAQLAP